MSLEDRQRLEEDLRCPRIVQLHMALVRLRSCIKFMNSGAHPDDETSALLAALAYRDGFDISYACANRGEGGQNDIGTESSAMLGTVRTAEMEAAARVLDLRLYWLSTHPQDTIFDFGFSKSGHETLRKWGHERTLQRFVSIVRREQPDILCPTFLDIPGQHGHHRAMTAMAYAVMERAADKDYRVDGSNDPAWQISKLFLPAWGGGGNAYDDEEPPPEETLRVSASGRDPVTGWSWENLGQQSRKFHLTQGMGRWVMSGDERDWPLHLAKTALDVPCEPTRSLESGLAYDFTQWAEREDNGQLASQLLNVHEALTATVIGFPDFRAVTENGFAAISSINQARQLAQSTANPVLDNRLARKQAQVTRAIMLASGVRATVWTPRTLWRPGDVSDINIDVNKPDVPGVHYEVGVLSSFAQPENSPWQIEGSSLSLSQSASLESPYPDIWLADEPTGPVVQVKLDYKCISTSYYQPLEVPPIVLSSVSAQLTPDVFLVNLERPPVALTVNVNKRHPDHAMALFSLPEGWSQEAVDNQLKLSMASTLEAGLYELPLQLDDCQANDERLLNYSHIKPRVFSKPSVLRVRATAIALPDVRIGYVGGGNDRVAVWLRAMGFDVHEISDEELVDGDALAQALITIDTLVVGVFAYRMRNSLASLAPTINSWVESGGHLLTLYHRPWDNWHPDLIPPARLEIGQPSLRYRVTDENADVTYLQEDHSVLHFPNVIQDDDWQGWHKERGLYFAKSWDSCYAPILSMKDPEELPHEGALLVATIGEGQHIHTSLILHHQMDMLVPGAFRLMANLLA
ncbi:MAG: PIG-L family deacetylase [Granulosicoccus sp.]